MPFVLPPETFSPICWREIPAYVVGQKKFVARPQSHAVHLYNEMWRRHKLDKNRRYPATSVLNILRRHAGIENLDTEAPPSILSLTARRITQSLFRRAA